MPARRFLFRGNAAATGGRLTRPFETLVNVGASSSIPDSGGHARSHTQGFRVSDILSFQTATTDVIGAVRGDVHETRINAVLERIDVLGVFKAELVSGALISRAFEQEDETHVVPEGSRFERVSINGHPVEIELDEDLFQKSSTFGAIEQKFIEDPDFRRLAAERFFWRRLDDKAPKHIIERFGWMGELLERDKRPPQSHGTALCTIVRSLKCNAPGIEIHGHVVRIPEFGSVYFGELLISRSSRRLNMLTFELGSPAEGRFEFASVEGNGSFFP